MVEPQRQILPGFNRLWSATSAEEKQFRQNRSKIKREYVPSYEREGFDESMVEVLPSGVSGKKK